MKKIVKNKYIQYIFVGVLFAIIPFIPGMSTSKITLFGAVLYLSIAALGYNVLMGYAGLISLGHAAFMGLGAYISAFLVNTFNFDFLLSLIIAAVVTLALGLLVGLIALRLSGLYLAIVTLGLGEIFRELFIEFSEIKTGRMVVDKFGKETEEILTITGGFSGVRTSYPTIFGIEFSKNATYILAAVLLVLSLIAVYNIINSSTGRALKSMKSSESAAQAMGISLFKYKIMAFALSTMFAGISGVVYVHFMKASDPTIWTSLLSLDIFAICVIGGLGTIGGAVLGSILYKWIPELLKMMPGVGDINGLPVLIYGVLVVIIALFYSQGLIHIPFSIKMALYKRKQRKAAAVANSK